MEQIATALKALGHPERLRIMALLSYGELTISELVQILGLSQPRVTQYINSLEQVGVIERLKEGSWVFSRLRRGSEAMTAIVATTLAALPKGDLLLALDWRRLEDVRAERAKAADAFFASVANDRGQLGDEYIPQADIEARMMAMVGNGPIEFMVDLGTGTGRILDLFADQVTRGSGIDNNSDMLKVARHNLVKSARTHLTVRQGDLHSTPMGNDVADLVTLHQVLHYLDEPRDAIIEAARLLSASGRLLIVDFETHDFEALRKDYAHRRLGFSNTDVARWMSEAGLMLSTFERVETREGRPNVMIWLGETRSENRTTAWQTR